MMIRAKIPTMMKNRQGGRERFTKLNAWLKRKYSGLDWVGLVVKVSGPRGSVQVSLVGRGQARGTAIGAALLARALIEGEVDRAGIWFAEQVVPIDPFFKRLAAHGLVPIVKEQIHP
jgi:hypothetical protein